MIVIERIEPTEPDGWVFIKTYSDAGRLIRQDGTDALYTEAIDPEFAHRTYTETDIPAEEDGITNDELVDIVFGGIE